MILLFKLIILTSIWCLGVKILTEQGMLLAKLGAYGHKKVEEGKIIFDPLIACEFCLPSIHSLIGYGFAIAMGIITAFSWKLVLIYPLVAMGSSIVTGFTWNGYQTLISFLNKNESEELFFRKEIEEFSEDFFNEIITN